jgi:hypothetical protein
MGISGPHRREGVVREAERVGMMRRMQCQFVDMSVATDQYCRVHHVTISLQNGHPLHGQLCFFRPWFQMKLVLRPRHREIRICGYYSKISQVMNLSSADSFQHHGRRDTSFSSLCFVSWCFGSTKSRFRNKQMPNHKTGDKTGGTRTRPRQANFPGVNDV